MRLYLLGIQTATDLRQRQTTTQEGPFIVLARDEHSARMLVSLNYSIAVERRDGEKIAIMVWTDYSASYCIPVSGDEDALRRRQMVAGSDIAPHYLHEPALISEGLEVARMVWWPLRSDDVCPLQPANFLAAG